jgi:transcriptional regulator with XRE-family HTH domain
MTPEQFKQTRKDLNLTQRQLARELGLSEDNGDRYIRRIESGEKKPSGLLLRALYLLEFYLAYDKAYKDIDDRYNETFNQPKQRGER